MCVLYSCLTFTRFTDYIKDGRDRAAITRLITIPTLTMGIGNFLFMPIALAIGRRPVYLFSCALLFISCIIAGFNTGYNYHLALRIIIGFAAGKQSTHQSARNSELRLPWHAGQSEALVPLMLKESFFLHERANILTFQSSFTGIIACVLTLVSSNIAASVGWKNWYLLYGGISGVIFVLASLSVDPHLFPTFADLFICAVGHLCSRDQVR